MIRRDLRGSGRRSVIPYVHESVDVLLEVCFVCSFPRSVVASVLLYPKAEAHSLPEEWKPFGWVPHIEGLLDYHSIS